MYIKDVMTPNPIVLKPIDSITEAFKKMKEGNFHRLPIVDEGKLVGLITGSTLADFAPSKATTLSVYEINSILAKTTCKDIMIKDVITISPNSLVEEAADIMATHNITCLPVVDDKSGVVGIITQKVIFKCFVEILGYYNKGCRVEILIEEDKPGILKDLSTILSGANISISHMVVERNGKDVKIIVRVDNSDQEFINNLLKDKYNIVDIRVNV